MNVCTARQCTIVLFYWVLSRNHIYPAATPPGGVFTGYASTIPKHLFSSPSFYLSQLISIDHPHDAQLNRFSQPMPMYLELQGPLFPPTTQYWFLLLTPPHLVEPAFFLHLVVSLGAKFPHIFVQRRPWRRKIRLGYWIFAMFPYLLISRQPGQVTLASTSLGSSWSTRLLREGSSQISNCTVWWSRKCVLWIIVLFELHLLSINRASLTFILLFSVITLVSDKRPLPTRLHDFWQATGRQRPWSYRWRIR